MFDSMIPDVLAADEGLVFEIRDLVAAGRLEVLVTHVQVDELVATPDLERRRRLLSPMFMIGARLVETSATYLGFEPDPDRLPHRQAFGGSRLGFTRLGDDETHQAIERLLQGRGVRHIEDALIIVSARDNNSILISDEKRASSWPALVPRLLVKTSTGFRHLLSELRTHDLPR
jgi:hypothetical protein